MKEDSRRRRKTKCTVIVAYDSTYWCEIENSYYILREIPKREKIEKEKEVERVENKDRKKYIPPANHPWRKDMKKFFTKS